VIYAAETKKQALLMKKPVFSFQKKVHLVGQ